MTDIVGKIDKNSHFYNHFVDERKVEAIADKKAQYQLSKYSLLLMAFTPSASLPFPLVFNTSLEILDNIFLFFGFGLFVSLLYFFVRFILVFNQHGIFKKKWMTLLFSPPFLLYPLLIFSYSLIRHFLPLINENYHLPLHPFEIFALTLPLLLAYTIFCCYCYRVCICKYPLKSSSEINSLHR